SGLDRRARLAMTASFVRGSARILLLGRRDGDDAQRAAAAVDDLERRRDDYRAGRRQLIEVAETREAELAGAVHDGVIGKRRRERGGLSRVGADGLDADAEHVAIERQQPRCRG